MLSLPDKEPAYLLIRHCLRDIKHRRHRALPDICTLICSAPRRPYTPRELLGGSINRRLIYIRIYKSASNTIQNWMQLKAQSLRPSENRFQRFIRILLLRRRREDIDKILDTFFPKEETPFLFSFVRNPFARHVSCYTNKVLCFQKNTAKQHSGNKLPPKN